MTPFPAIGCGSAPGRAFNTSSRIPDMDSHWLSHNIRGYHRVTGYVGTHCAFWRIASVMRQADEEYFLLLHVRLFPLLVLFISVFISPAFAQSNPSPAACGLPKQGKIRLTVTYTLTANCAQTGELQIDEDVTLTIVGGG